MVANGPEIDGKLTLNSTTIQVEGSATKEINLPDILEADFADSAFHLDYFCSNDQPEQLPPDWKAQNIGKVDVPGSFSYTKGTFEVTSGSHEITDWSDSSEHSFFIGRPWTGNGQWTLHLKELDPQNPNALAGLVLREGLDPGTGGMYQIEARQDRGAVIFMRNADGGRYSQNPPVDIPVWLRVTRNGMNLAIATSSDGKNWNTIDQNTTKFSSDTWAGLLIGNDPKPVGKAVMDQITFMPGPSLSETIPSGVLLRSGSYLAGNFGQFDLTGSAPVGNFSRNGKEVSIPAAQVATVVLYPTTRRQIADLGSQIGLFMKNKDFMVGDIESIYWGDHVRINSLILGDTTYDASAVQALFFHPLQPQLSEYEIRLTDGSIIRATSLGATKGQLVITEVSGIKMTVDPSEIAQFRAGSTHAQNLLELSWKASPQATTVQEPSAISTPSGSAVPGANLGVTKDGAQVTMSEAPQVEGWEGNNQEQILVVPAGLTIDFPLNGNFRALALKITLSPDSPPDSLAIVRILADGKEVARTSNFKAGDQPRFVEVKLQNPKILTLVADSTFPGTRVLFIDPVVIREKQY